MKLLKRTLRKGSPYYQTEERIILRDYLALERTLLANERTFFTYIKFSLYLLIAAITIWKVSEFASLSALAYLFVTLSGVFLIIGAVRYFALRKRLNAFFEEPPKAPDQEEPEQKPVKGVPGE